MKTFSTLPAPSRKLRLGLCGAGGFAGAFGSLFKAHPWVESVVAADLHRDRAEAMNEKFGFSGVMGSLDELCESDVDAIALFTARYVHGPQAVQALRAGKDVYCAVPIGCTLEEIADVVRAVEETGRIYMTGETSYYYPQTIYCRGEFASGRWGHFVHASAQYVHDMATFAQHFFNSGGDQWRRYAGIPPLLYATHSLAMPLSVTGARATHVSAHGYVDTVDDGIFGKGLNEWDNAFSNQTALFRTSDGGTMRIGEYRRMGWFGGGKEVMMPAFLCTDSCFEEDTMNSCLLERGDFNDNILYSNDIGSVIDLTDKLHCTYHCHGPATTEEEATQFRGLSSVHRADRLPESFRGLPNGHGGSHQFLVDDFVKAACHRLHPPNNVWAAARYAAPGLVAHRSSLQGGELLEVPDFGQPPEGQLVGE